MSFKRYSSGTRWEPVAGYSRAVKAGNTIQVSGTTATDEEGHIVAKGDPYKQTRVTLANIEKALKYFGVTLDAVYRTRMYVANIDHWQHVARAHGEVFEEVRPATTLVEVSRLIAPDILVEIEAEAYCG